MKTAFSFDYASTASGYENKLLIDQAPAYRKLKDYNKWKTTRNSAIRALHEVKGGWAENSLGY
jgi:hypothetical protein